MITGYSTITLTQASIKKQLGDIALRFTEDVLIDIQRLIKQRVYEMKAFVYDFRLEEYACSSNQEFEVLEFPQQYIEKIDSLWVAGVHDPLIEKILSNPLSQILKRRVEF